MLSVQCLELINPDTNRGLLPDLAVDEPSISYLFRSADPMVAALQSELGFLANPVGITSRPRTWANQALKIARAGFCAVHARRARRAHPDLGRSSCGLCQALDLRAMSRFFLRRFRPAFGAELHNAFTTPCPPEHRRQHEGETAWLDEAESSLWS